MAHNGCTRFHGLITVSTDKSQDTYENVDLATFNALERCGFLYTIGMNKQEIDIDTLACKFPTGTSKNLVNTLGRRHSENYKMKKYDAQPHDTFSLCYVIVHGTYENCGIEEARLRFMKALHDLAFRCDELHLIDIAINLNWDSFEFIERKTCFINSLEMEVNLEVD